MSVELDFVKRFIEKLRDRADDRRREGAPTAQVYDRIADELEAEKIAFESTPLALTEAVKESGYSACQLRRLRREGKTTLTPADLPRKPRARPGPRAVGDQSKPSLADEVLSGGRRLSA